MRSCRRPSAAGDARRGLPSLRRPDDGRGRRARRAGRGRGARAARGVRDLSQRRGVCRRGLGREGAGGARSRGVRPGRRDRCRASRRCARANASWSASSATAARANGAVRASRRCARRGSRSTSARRSALAGGGPIVQGLRCGGVRGGGRRTRLAGCAGATTPPGGEPSRFGLRGDDRRREPHQRAGRVGPGQTVVVIGAGGVGLNAVQGAAPRRSGCRDRDRRRRREARRREGVRGDERGERPFLRSSGRRARARRRRRRGDRNRRLGPGRRAGPRALAPGRDLVVVGMPASGEEARFDPTLLAHDGMRIVGTKIGSARPADDIPRLVAPLRGRPAEARRAGDGHLPARPDQRSGRGRCGGARRFAT